MLNHKNVFFCVVFSFSVLTVFAGKIGNSHDSLQLGISCSPKEIKSENDLNFILAVTNSNRSNVLLPSKFIATPGSAFAGNMGYDVIFLEGQNSTNFTEKIIANYDGKQHYPKTNSVASGHTFYFSIKVKSIYFWEKGTYKIRFFLRKKSFLDLLSQDLYSDWVYLTVMNDDVWPDSKTGAGPLMRQ
jgi:hypothetical protein